MKQGRSRDIIRAGTTVEQMVRAISGLIVTGNIRPGDKRDEGSLAGRFEVSRTPVRGPAPARRHGSRQTRAKPQRRGDHGRRKYLNSMFEAMAELEGICAASPPCA